MVFFEKFGKQIQHQAHPEWAHHYMNYKGLKKIIGTLEPGANGVLTVASAEPDSDHHHRQNTMDDDDEEGDSPRQALKTAFFFRVDRELEKVNTFYLKKESELKVRLRSLVDKKRVLQVRNQPLQQTLIWRSLHEAFGQYQQELDKLQQFIEINGTGFRKILKKWDKVSRSTTKDLYLSRQVKAQDCFNRAVVAELADACATNLADIEALMETPTSPSDSAPPAIPANSAVVDLEAELANAIAAGQPTVMQEVLDRHLTLLAPETQRDYLSLGFWRACSEAAPLECLTLLSHTGNVDYGRADDISSRICLHEAALQGALPLLTICLERGAPINSSDVYGRTALHYASMHGFLGCAEALLAAGADPSPMDHEGFTGLLYAISAGFTDGVKILLSALGELGQDAGRALLLACQYGHQDIAELLLTKQPDIQVNPDLANGLYPLHLACREGHAEICRLLTRNGSDLNILDGDKGWTPLFHAASEGHLSCCQAMLEAGCRKDIVDEAGLTPVYYAAYEGHSECVDLLLTLGCPAQVISPPPTNPTHDLNLDLGGSLEGAIDDIPSLLLPPPLLPFRIYGHNFLDQRYLVQIRLGLPSRPPVQLYGNSKISSLKLILAPRPADVQGSDPQSVILPLAEGSEEYTFEVDHLAQFGMEFSIYPTFGSKVMGKAVALPAQFHSASSSHCTCPLFDAHLKVVGEINFSFQIVKPYRNADLEVGGRIETYWRSPAQDAPIPPLLGTNRTLASLVTASSLAQEYVQLAVQVTRDMVPIVCPEWGVDLGPIKVQPSTLTLDQFQSLRPKGHSLASPSLSTSPTQLRNLAHTSYLSLAETLKWLPDGLGVCLDVRCPLPPNLIGTGMDINLIVDHILDVVYSYANATKVHRSYIFSSFQPQVCNALNWKQPNYAVFISTTGGWGDNPFVESLTSLKVAVQFAKRNNLLGIICHAPPLIKVPVLAQLVKEAGFLLASYATPQYPATDIEQELAGVDAVITHGVLRYGAKQELLSIT